MPIGARRVIINNASRAAPPAPPGDGPPVNFSLNTNSMYVAVLEDF